MFSIPRLPFREDTGFSLSALLFLTVPLAFNWNLNEKFETIKFAIWVFLLGIIFLYQIFKNEVFLPKGRIAYFFYFWLFLGLVSAIFSVSPVLSFFGFYPRFTSGFLFYFVFLFTLFFLLSNLVREKQEFLVKVLYFDGILVALVGILQSFGVGYYEGVGQAAISRAPSLLGNPNFSSMFLVSILPFGLPLFLKAQSLKAKVYYALGTFLMLWATLNLSSRGAWAALILGLLVGAVLVFKFKFSKRSKFLVLGGLLASCFVMAAFLQMARPEGITSVVKFYDQSLTSRFFSWEVSLGAIKKHALLGYGPGTLQLYYEKYRPGNINGQAGVFDDAHNLFLQMGATTGLLFATLFYVGCIYALWVLYKNLPNSNSQVWNWATFVSLVIWLIASFFNPVSIANFLLLVGLLAGVFYTQVEMKRVSLNKGFKIVLNLVFFSVSFYGITFISAEFFYFAGRNKFIMHDFVKSQKYIKVATYLNPFNQSYLLYSTANEIILNSKNLDVDIGKVVNRQPQSARSQVMGANLSYLLYDISKDERYLNQAINYMNQSLVMDKYSAFRYAHAAFYLAEANRLSMAREYLKTGLTLDPQNLAAWILLARVYQLENRPAQLQYALKEASKLRPEEVYLKNLSEESEKTKDIKKLAIPAYINVLQIEP